MGANTDTGLSSSHFFRVLFGDPATQGSGPRPVHGLRVDLDESAIASVTSFDSNQGYRIRKEDLALFIEDPAERAAAIANITDTESIIIVNVPAVTRAHVQMGPNQVQNTDDPYYRIAPPPGFPVERDPFTFRPNERLIGEYEIRVELTVTFGQNSYDGTFFFIGIANDDTDDNLTATNNAAFGGTNDTEIDEGPYANGILLANLVKSGDPDGGGSGGLRVTKVEDGTGSDHTTYSPGDFEIRGNQLWLTAGEALIYSNTPDNNTIMIEVAITTNGAGAPTAHTAIVELVVQDVAGVTPNTAPTISYDTTATGTTQNDGTVTVVATSTVTHVAGHTTAVASGGGQLVQNFDIADANTSAEGLTVHAYTAFTANATTNPANAAFNVALGALDFTNTGSDTVAGQYGTFTLTRTGTSGDLTVTYALSAETAQATAVNALTADSVEELVIYAYDTTDGSTTPIEFLVELDVA
jgi:hypothetical protein